MGGSKDFPLPWRLPCTHSSSANFTGQGWSGALACDKQQKAKHTSALWLPGDAGASDGAKEEGKRGDLLMQGCVSCKPCLTAHQAQCCTAEVTGPPSGAAGNSRPSYCSHCTPSLTGAVTLNKSGCRWWKWFWNDFLKVLPASIFEFFELNNMSRECRMKQRKLILDLKLGEILTLDRGRMFRLMKSKKALPQGREELQHADLSSHAMARLHSLKCN